MAGKDSPELDPKREAEDHPGPRAMASAGEGVGTHTIDLEILLGAEHTFSGSFDLRGPRKAPLINLLNSLPICSFLIDQSYNIVFLNDTCSTTCQNYHELMNVSFLKLLPKAGDTGTATSVLDNVFNDRRPRVWEALLDLQGQRLWARMHLRSLRLEEERLVLLLIQDLTLEKKHLMLIKKNEHVLRKAADELEKRVAERTTELNSINERLRKEILDRKHAELALQKANEDLERRVGHRTAELVTMNEQLRQEIEQRRQAEEERQKSQETIEALFNATTDAAFLVDTHGALLALNKSFAALHGKVWHELVGKRLVELMPPQVMTMLAPRFIEVIQTGQAVRFEAELDSRVTDNTFYPVRSGDGRVSGVAVFSRDITQRKQAEEKLGLAAKVIESSNEAVIITDIHGIIVDVNEAFCRLTGYSPDEVIGENPRIMKSDRHDPEFYQHMWIMLRETGSWQGEVWDRRKNGEVYPKLLSISAVRNNVGEVTHYVGIFSDITKIKQTEERLQHLAHFDPLTHLPNRLLFRDRLQHALIETSRHRKMVALILLDLDGFKNINDSLGHKAGDDLLTAVAQRLTKCVRESDTVARLGGDEFTIVLPEIPDGQAAANVGLKISDVLAQPYDLDGKEVFVTASMGITVYPTDGAKVDRLLQNADMALYRAKEQGKNKFQFFSEEMNREVVNRLDLESALRVALDRNEFVVYYQPRLFARSGRFSGAEALLRWQHPARGLVSPDTFISLAEETGLITSIGEWVLRVACRQEKSWQDAGFPKRRIAVNVSARQLSQPGLVQIVQNVFTETGLDPNCLELELTESVAMKDADATIRIFSELKKIGVHLCIDDFGTGYSSLSYLRRFPLDHMKVDKSFVDNCATNPDDGAIVETIIAMAHTLKLEVVAEGVETKEQLEFLKRLRCDEWQGYYCSRPLPAADMTELFQRGAFFAG